MFAKLYFLQINLRLTYLIFNLFFSSYHLTHYDSIHGDYWLRLKMKPACFHYSDRELQYQSHSDFSDIKPTCLVKTIQDKTSSYKNLEELDRLILRLTAFSLAGICTCSFVLFDRNFLVNYEQHFNCCSRRRERAREVIRSRFGHYQSLDPYTCISAMLSCWLSWFDCIFTYYTSTPLPKVTIIDNIPTTSP